MAMSVGELALVGRNLACYEFLKIAARSLESSRIRFSQHVRCTHYRRPNALHVTGLRMFSSGLGDRFSCGDFAIACNASACRHCIQGIRVYDTWISFRADSQ